MARMTDEEIKRLPKGTVVWTKCDHCATPLTRCLTYRSNDGKREFCSNTCYEAAEGGRGTIQPTVRKEKTVIEPTSNKAAAPAAPPAGTARNLKAKWPKAGEPAKPQPDEIDPDAPQPDDDDEQEKPVKKATKPAATKQAEAATTKQGKPAAAPTKTKQTAAPAKAATKQGKPAAAPAKAKQSKSAVDWTAQNKVVEDRLRTGKPLTIADLFDGTLYKDKSRILSFLVDRLRSEGHDVVRDTKARTIKLVKAAKAKK